MNGTVMNSLICLCVSYILGTCIEIMKKEQYGIICQLLKNDGRLSLPAHDRTK